jgi:hypothetical protein
MKKLYKTKSEWFDGTFSYSNPKTLAGAERLAKQLRDVGLIVRVTVIEV